MRVLVLDGDTRAALAVTRSLGRAGHAVHVGERRMPALAQSSRYCAQPIAYPDPVTDAVRFVEYLTSYVREAYVDVLLPIADISTFLVARHRADFPPSCVIPLGPSAAIERAANKVDIVQTAERLGVPVPRSVVVSGSQERVQPPFDYPVVVKPHQSRIWVDGRWASTSVSYADTPDALVRDLAARPAHQFPVLVQEKISGPGTGVFALYQNGHAVATFSHRRVRERPPWGGVSVLSESIAMDPMALECATRLLDDLGWQGVAMVEFKRDVRDDRPKLMEINGRFWGSLQLAVDAGVDFPDLLLRAACGERLTTQPPYRIGARTRWLWGDFDALLLTLLRDRGPTSRTAGARLRSVVEFLKVWQPQLHYESPMARDLGPFVFETRERLGLTRSRTAPTLAFAPARGLAPLPVPSATRAAPPLAASAPPMSAPTFTARVAKSFDVAELDDGRWNEIAATSPPHSVFQTSQWLKSWYATLGAGRELFLVLRAKYGTVTGLVPLFVDGHSGDRIIRMLGDGRADYCDAIGADKLHLVTGLFDVLRSYHNWDELCLNNIPAHSQTVAAIEAVAAHQGYRASIEDQYVCPTLLIRDHEAEVDALLTKVSVRRKVNALAREGVVSCRHLTSAEEVEPYLDRFFDQHIRRWRQTDTPSLFEDPAKVAFYRLLTRAIGPMGWLLFTVLELDGQPVAFHYGFDYRGTITWYKPAFEVAYADRSPGTVLLSHLIAYARRQGRRELDFTVGDEAFKRRFTNAVRGTVQIRLFRHASRYAVEVSKQRMTAAVKRAVLVGGSVRSAMGWGAW